MLVKFRNDMGINREVKVGFSWTSFFFGGFPFLFRGMPLHGLGWIFLAIVTFGISNLILSFIINKQTAVHYLENGYKPEGPNWDVAASRWDISLPQQENVQSTPSAEGAGQQSTTSSSEIISIVVAPPAPLILVGGAALCVAVVTQAGISGFISWEFMGMANIAIAVLNLGAFIWAANEYLDKIEHKVFAISLMVMSSLVTFSAPYLFY